MFSLCVWRAASHPLLGVHGLAKRGSYSAGYSYLANSPLAGQIDFKQSTTLRMRTVKSYDYLNRLGSIASHPGGTPSLGSLSFAYQYNDANQRTRMTLADGSYWIYDYDRLDQVTSGKRYSLVSSLVLPPFLIQVSFLG